MATRRGGPSAREVVGAAQRADLEALERLLARGADLDALYRNYRPLHALIQEQPHGAEEQAAFERESPARLACLDWLLVHGADPEGLGAWPTMRATVCAAFVGAPRFVARLLEAGVERDLVVLAALGEREEAEARLAGQPELARTTDASGITPLIACVGARLGLGDARAEAERQALARALLARGADPNVRLRSWGHDVDTAYFAASPARLELLLAHGADATSALVSAAWRTEAHVDACLRHGGRIDAAREGDRPILNELVRWGQLELALRLLARGASPNVADPRGWTALHQAVSRGNERMLAALLAAGGDPEREDGAGLSVRALAAMRGKPRLVALLAAPDGRAAPEQTARRPARRKA